MKLTVKKSIAVVVAAASLLFGCGITVAIAAALGGVNTEAIPMLTIVGIICKNFGWLALIDLTVFGTALAVIFKK